MIKDRTGEIYTFSDGRTMTIIEYITNKNMKVMFNDGTVVDNCYYAGFLKGDIKNNNTPIIYGVGYFGYGPYASKIKGITTLPYSRWKNILNRCYREDRQQKQISYELCFMNPEWHNYQVFAKWFEENYINGFEIDKDILFKGNKVYSAETCCFVSSEINKLLTNRKIKRGSFLIGVSYYKKIKKYMSCIHINGVQKHLGYFYTEKEAFDAYKTAKEQNIKDVADKFKDEITPECYDALINWTIDIND